MAYNPSTVGTTQAAVFIPELWSDEVIAAYKANLVLGNLVTRFNHNGRKGDTIHLPTPTRGSASLYAGGNTTVTTIQNTEGEIQLSIDKHFEYSRHIEDIVGAQALDSIRMFYTDDAGYALANVMDSELHEVAELFQGGAISTTTSQTAHFEKAKIGSDGSTDYDGSNAAALTDAGIRNLIQLLDDVNIPQADRFLVIPPVEKNNLLGEPRFTEQAFVGEVGAANSIRNGRIGGIYGVDVYVSTNCITSTESDGARIAILMHRTAMALVTQLGIRVQTQYKQEYLSTLLTADSLFGVGELRNDAGVAIAVAA